MGMNEKPASNYHASGNEPSPAADGQEQEQKLHHGGSHRVYMAHKVDKLQQQFANDASSIPQESSIFEGVGILVNGWTRPSATELKLLMAVHGGRFENYYSRSTVTHIIATNLPDAKVKLFCKERNPTPILRPEWILDSIAAGALLPTSNYVLSQLRDAPGQRTIKGFANAGTTDASDHRREHTPLKLGPVREHEARWVHRQAVAPKTTTEKLEQHASCNYDPARLTAAQQLAARLRADCDVLKGPPKSSKDDENFVEHYYKASRLHFIGRWKARLENLMASKVAGAAPAPAPWGTAVMRNVLHIDMDCFFASIAEAGRPEFHGLPLAVCHSNSTHGSGEVSSANYEARRYGITASMFISRAKERCPALIVVPYEFEKYETASEQVYRILLKYTACVQPLSCDEAFLDVTGLGDPEAIAASMRAEIFAATGCTASAGIGPNMLLARLATKRAKPNGQFLLSATTAGPFLIPLPVQELPGVGWRTGQKLEELGVRTVGDLVALGKARLQASVGLAIGAVLWEYAHGRDDRKVEPPKARKSVGAEVNWGIRFQKPEDPENFMGSLVAEVAERMRQAGVRGRTVTVKVKRKKAVWQEPPKFLGMGACDSLSRSVTLANAICAEEPLRRESIALLRALRVPFEDIRGIGLSVSKLDTSERASEGPSKQRREATIETAFAAAVNARVNAAQPAVVGEDARGDAEGVRPREIGGCEQELQETGINAHAEPDEKKGKIKENDLEKGGDSMEGRSQRGIKRKVSWSELEHNAIVFREGEVFVASEPVADLNNPEEDIKTDRGRAVSLAAEDVGEDEGHDTLMTWKNVAQRYRGKSLTQIDAEELASLPWQVQRQLIDTLPRSRNNIAEQGGIGMNDGTVEERESHPLNHPDDEVTLLEKESIAKGRGSEERVELQPDGPQAQQHGGHRGHHAADVEQAHLPSFSQLDRSVLDALPLELRRELETHYKLAAAPHRRAAPAASKMTTTGTRGRGGPRSAAMSRHAVLDTSRLQRIDAFVVTRDGKKLSAAVKRHGTAQHAQPIAPLTFSQIDPGVLEELPDDVQREIVQQLRPLPRSKAAKLRSHAAAAAAGLAVKENRHVLRAMQDDRQEVSSDGDDGWELGVARGQDLPASVSRLVQAAEAEQQPAMEEVACLLETAVSEIAVRHHERLANDVNEAPAQVPSMQVQDDGFDMGERVGLDASELPKPRVQVDGAAYSSIIAVLRGVEAAVVRLARPFVAADMEQLRALMLRVNALGNKHACFACCAQQIVDRLQERARRRYGWPLSLRTLLQ